MCAVMCMLSHEYKCRALQVVAGFESGSSADVLDDPVHEQSKQLALRLHKV